MHVEHLRHENDKDDGKDAYICEINANDHCRLCKSGNANDLVLG